MPGFAPQIQSDVGELLNLIGFYGKTLINVEIIS